jgi:elongator complex protein 1
LYRCIQGGRKPSRKQRRGKKGTGLRAGGPTEERDLAMHLAGGGVAPNLLMPRALEEVGLCKLHSLRP